MKRSKNIFNSPILPESLYDEEGEKKFKIGQKQIKPDWLKEVPNQDYIPNIYSAMHLSELQKQLEDLKDQAQVSNAQNNEGNMFQIAHLKKKIDTFSLQQNKAREQEQNLKVQLSKKQPPKCDALILQKISGFMDTSYQRKCKIEQKQLLIETKKGGQINYVPIFVQQYIIELQERQKPLSKPGFQAYIWLPSQLHRLLLSGSRKPYCMYGPVEHLKALQRFYQVDNSSIKKQLGIFSQLSHQFQQKIITLFGDKVRFYDHNKHVKKVHKEIIMTVIKSNLNSNNLQEKGQEKQIYKHQNNLSNSNASREDRQKQEFCSPNSSGIHNGEGLNKMATLTSQIIFESPKIRPKSNSKFSQNQTTFKLRGRSGTVYYDQLQPALSFEDAEPPKEYNIGDIKLNLKQEGMSQVDDELQQSSSSMHRELRKKVLHYTLESDLNAEEKYSINIYNVSSVNHSEYEGLSENSDGRSHFSRRKSDSSIFNSNKLDNISHISNIRKASDDVNSNNSQLQKHFLKKSESHQDIIALTFEDKVELQRQSDAERLSVKSSSDKQNSVKSRKFFTRHFQKQKTVELGYLQNFRKASLYLTIEKLELFLPYNTHEIPFEIVQLDPELQIDKRFAVCSKNQGLLVDSSISEKTQGKYISYFPKQSQSGLNFKISDESNEFLFIIKQLNRDVQIPFSLRIPNKIDYIETQKLTTNRQITGSWKVYPKYQTNQSQLLLKSLDNSGYMLAGKLSLYVSPQPIKIPQKCSTVQFLFKYLQDAANDYNFKANFIDEKKTAYLLNYQWNKKLIKQIINDGDATSFQKAVFKGMPSSIYQKLREKSRSAFKDQDLFTMNENDVRLIEDNIISSVIYDIRIFMKPSALINKIMTSQFNGALLERFKQIYAYFLNKYGSARNLSFVFIKQVLLKIENVIILAKKEEEVYAIIDLYFEVEYQIDQLFADISKYFKK